MSSTKSEIAYYLQGSCTSIAQAAETCEVSEETVLEAIVDAGMEMCTVCGWWADDGEYDFPDGSDCVCNECADEAEEE